MEGERGNQADNTLWDAKGCGNKVRLIEDVVTRQTVHASAELLESAAVAQGVKRSPMNAKLQGARRAEYTAVHAEHL
jgi:hypothetical protein